MVLDREGIAFFKLQVKDMLPGVALFTEDGQKAWRRDMWAEAVRKAVAVHNKTALGAARVPSGPPLIVSGMLESVSCCRSTEWTHLRWARKRGPVSG